MRILRKMLAGSVVALGAWVIFQAAQGTVAALAFAVAITTLAVTVGLATADLYEASTLRPGLSPHGRRGRRRGRDRRQRCGSCHRKKVQLNLVWVCQRCDLVTAGVTLPES